MLAPLATSLVQPVIFSILKGISGRGVRRAGRGYTIKIFSSTPSFKQYKITNYFNNDPKFNGVFLRKNLHRIKDEAYVINLDHKNSKGTHWVSLFIDRNIALYFDSFAIEYIPLDVLNKIKDNYSQYL